MKTKLIALLCLTALLLAGCSNSTSVKSGAGDSVTDMAENTRETEATQPPDVEPDDADDSYGIDDVDSVDDVNESDEVDVSDELDEEDVTVGIDTASESEFEAYDNTEVTGVQVSTALSLFQGRDVAIVIQTKAFREIPLDIGLTIINPYGNLALNYGAVLTSDHKPSKGSTNSVMKTEVDYSGYSIGYGGEEYFITDNAKTAYVVAWSDYNTEGTAIARGQEDTYYVGCLHDTSGLVDTNYDVIGTTESGNAAYIVGDAQFTAMLVKNPDGKTIGIFFRETD